MKYYGILFATIFHCANASNAFDISNDLKEKKAAVETAVEWLNGTKQSKKLTQAISLINKQSEYIEALEKQSYSNENLKNQFQHIEKLENSLKDLKHNLDEEKERNELFRSQLVVLIQENDENKNLKEKIKTINEENQNILSRYESDILCLEEIYETKIHDLKTKNEDLEKNYLDTNFEYKKLETDYTKLQADALVQKETFSAKVDDLKSKLDALSKKYQLRKSELESYKSLYQSMLAKEKEDATVTLIIPDDNNFEELVK